MNTTARTLRPLVTLLAAAGLTLGAAAAQADPWFSNGASSHSMVDGNVVDVEVRVDGGTAPLYFKPGTSDRHYFQAFQGRNYSLVVRNTTGSRVGVLIAVDGLNVVDGQRSTLDRHEQMYVLDPYESADIQGWRTSLDDIRRFVFVDENRSYAARTGQANGDMGWIRVVAYRENAPQVWWDKVTRPRRPYRDDARDGRSQLDGGAQAPQAEGRANEAPMAKGSMKAEGFSMDQAPQAQTAPGTGWGDHRYDPVQQTTFEPQRWAADQITLRYEYASGLRALGIFPRRSRVFDRERGELGFAQPPRW